MSDKRYYFFSDFSVQNVHVFAISDGMGEHNAGEVASRICVEKLASIHERLQHYSSLKSFVAYLQTVIAEINETVCGLSRKHDELKGMGSTLVLFVSCENGCTVLNVGNSRAYHFTAGKLIQITKDNTEGQRMLALGLLTRNDGILILYSDGVSDFVSESRIAEILNSEKNLDVAGKQLIDEAVASQNSDNATIILIPLGR